MERIGIVYRFSPLSAYVDEFGKKDVVFSWEVVEAARAHGVELKGGHAARLANRRRAQYAGYVIVRHPYSDCWRIADNKRGKVAYVSVDVPEEERGRVVMDAFLSLLK